MTVPGLEDMVKKPEIDSSVFVADGAVVIGDVTLCENSSVWFNSTIRGDRGSIYVGRGSNVQDGSVLHTDRGFNVHVGDNVTIGHGAIVHGCVVGDGTLIGMGAVILNGAQIGKECIIGAGAVVTQNAVIPDRSLVVGCPGKIIKSVSDVAAIDNIENANVYIEEAKLYLSEK